MPFFSRGVVVCFGSLKGVEQKKLPKQTTIEKISLPEIPRDLVVVQNSLHALHTTQSRRAVARCAPGRPCSAAAVSGTWHLPLALRLACIGPLLGVRALLPVRTRRASGDVEWPQPLPVVVRRCLLSCTRRRAVTQLGGERLEHFSACSAAGECRALSALPTCPAEATHTHCH